MSRNIVPDSPSIEVPYLSYEDRDALNRLTVYGRPVLEGSHLRCGCFHCGSTFTGSDVVDWIPEEDGEDTALCPYCGCDAVIYETDAFPVSTALLSRLYIHWFASEYKEQEKAATYVPAFSDDADYHRRGMPFLMEPRAGDTIAGKVELFHIDDLGNATGFMHEDDDAWYAKELAEGESGGMVRIVPHYGGRRFASGGESVWVTEYFEFIDAFGHRLPFEPWGQSDERLICDLYEQYGERLKGLILSPCARTMRLVVA